MEFYRDGGEREGEDDDYDPMLGNDVLNDSFYDHHFAFWSDTRGAIQPQDHGCVALYGWDRCHPKRKHRPLSPRERLLEENAEAGVD